MNILGKEVPCGCEDRKHIMFEQGNLDWRIGAVLILVPLTVYAIGKVTAP